MAKTQPKDLSSYTEPTLADRSIEWLKIYFNKAFEEEGNWADFEPETLLLELVPLAEEETIPLETVKKVLLLLTLEDDPDRFYTDPLFTVHAVEIMNNTSHSDPESVPYVTSLELAYAVNMVGSMYPRESTLCLEKVCEYFLKEEGYTYAPWPFDFVDDNNFPETQSKQDMKNKEKAIRAYLKLMERKDR